MRGLLLVLIVAACLVTPGDAFAIGGVFPHPAAGSPAELTGQAGCVSHTGSSGRCVDGDGLLGPRDVAVSPDGRFVYAVSSTSDAVVALRRDLKTGGLSQVGCVSSSGGGSCAQVRGLIDPSGLAISPDGLHVYVAAAGSDTLAVFSRSLSTGGLTQLPGTFGCLIDARISGACASARGLKGVRSVAVSPDGLFVYAAASGSDAVSVFLRNPVNGALTQPAGRDGCIGNGGLLGAGGTFGSCATGHDLGEPVDLALSADGRSLYVAAHASRAIAQLRRDPRTGALSQAAGAAGCVGSDAPGAGADCAFAHASGAPQRLALSGDDRLLYVVTAGDLVDRFGRDSASGALTFFDCVSAAGDRGCRRGPPGIGAGTDVAVAAPPQTVYVADALGTVAAFDAELRPIVRPGDNGANGCLSVGAPGCRSASSRLDEPRALAASPDGRDLYTAVGGENGVLALQRELAPECTEPPAVRVPFETSRRVALPCRDRDGDALTFSPATDERRPTHGTVTAIDQATRTATYTPPAAFIGADAFVVSASDGAQSALSRIPVSVVGGPGQPVCDDAAPSPAAFEGAPDDPLVIEQGGSATIALQCIDPDGSKLSFALVEPPAHGSVGPLGDRVLYTPDEGFAGTDSFTFQASDGTQASNAARVTVRVVAPPDTSGPAVGICKGGKCSTAGLGSTGVVSVGLLCPPLEPACKGFVSVRSVRGSELGTAPFRMRGARATVRVRLSRRARRRLRSRRRLRVRIVVSARDRSGNVGVSGRTLILRRTP